MTDTDLDQEEARLRAEAAAAYEAAIKRPTIANRKAHKTAEDALAEFLKARHEPEPTEPVFSGLTKVLEHLQGDNWKIAKTKLYDDSNGGKLRAEPDGTYTLSSVNEYARLHLQKEDGTPGGIAAGPSLQEEKIREEVGRIRADRLQREMKLREATGELIKKSDVEMEHAKRIVYLRSDLKNIFRAGAVEIIRTVGGDPQKAPSLIAYGVGLIDAALDRYARPIRVGDDD